MLPRKKLLPLKKEFDRIRANSKRYDSPSFGLLVSYVEVSGPRCAFIVSKKIDKRSVVRHQVKRKLSDAVSPFLPRLPRNVGLVFLAKQNAVGPVKEALQEEVQQVLERAKLL